MFTLRRFTKEISRRMLLLRENKSLAGCQGFCSKIPFVGSLPVNGDKVYFSKEQMEKDAAEYMANLNEDQRKLLNIIKLEFDVFICKREKTPCTEITDVWMVRLLELGKSSNVRKKFYKAYIQECLKQEKKEIVKKSSKIKTKQEVQDEEPTHADSQRNLSYRFLPPFYSTNNQRLMENCRVVQSMLLGNRPIVIDMSYEAEMKLSEKLSLVDQLLSVYSFNRRRPEPANLMFANWSKQSILCQKLHSAEHFMANTTEQSYLDVYPKKNLVYITPDARHDLLEDHPDNIYIVGAYHSKGNVNPLSLAKAKQENIRFAKLPLDQFLLWRTGSKRFSVQLTLQILITFMEMRDWNSAFGFVPKGYYISEDQLQERENNTNTKRSIFKNKNI